MVNSQPDDDGDGPSTVDSVARSDESRTVLVVGRVPSAAIVAAARRLFTDAALDRLQLLVTTRSTDRASLVPPHVERVHYRSNPQASETPVDAEGEQVVDGRLSTLGWTVSKRVLEFQRLVDDGSADVRLCFDALSDLLAAHERECVFRFVHMMTGQIRKVGGLGQFHLPVPWDSGAVMRLAPLFDALMELRAVDGTYQYRWRLGAGPTEWQGL